MLIDKPNTVGGGRASRSTVKVAVNKNCAYVATRIFVTTLDMVNLVLGSGNRNSVVIWAIDWSCLII